MSPKETCTLVIISTWKYVKFMEHHQVKWRKIGVVESFEEIEPTISTVLTSDK